MLSTIIAFQRLGEGLGAALDARVSQGRQLLTVSFPEEGIENGQAGHPGQVTEDVMDLEVHLAEGLLPVLGVLAGWLPQTLPLTQGTAQDANLILGAGRKEAESRP